MFIKEIRNKEREIGFPSFPYARSKDTPIRYGVEGRDLFLKQTDAKFFVTLASNLWRIKKEFSLRHLRLSTYWFVNLIKDIFIVLFLCFFYWYNFFRAHFFRKLFLCNYLGTLKCIFLFKLKYSFAGHPISSGVDT